ncbi:MAG: arylsulfatase A-like enzyme, partial [Polaribacter sp.]
MRKHLFIYLMLLSIIKIQAQDQSNPNILFIAIDDLKPTLGIYGDSFAVTPNIDAIAKNGTTFLNNHTQQAICGPSRASLLTGKRPDYTKVWDLKTKMRDVNPTILTIPQYFKQSGYKTIGVGKIYDPRCVDN